MNSKITNPSLGGQEGFMEEVTSAPLTIYKQLEDRFVFKVLENQHHQLAIN